jgi:hypothetical protein
VCLLLFHHQVANDQAQALLEPASCGNVVVVRSPHASSGRHDAGRRLLKRSSSSVRGQQEQLGYVFELLLRTFLVCVVNFCLLSLA